MHAFMSVSNTVTLFLLLILALCDFPSPSTGVGPVPSRGSCVPVTQPEADAVRRRRCFMSLPALCHCPGESPTIWTNRVSWESSSASCGCAASSGLVRRKSDWVHVYVKMCACSHVPQWKNLLLTSSRSPMIWFKVFPVAFFRPPYLNYWLRPLFPNKVVNHDFFFYHVFFF